MSTAGTPRSLTQCRRCGVLAESFRVKRFPLGFCPDCLRVEEAEERERSRTAAIRQTRRSNLDDGRVMVQLGYQTMQWLLAACDEYHLDPQQICGTAIRTELARLITRHQAEGRPLKPGAAP